MTFLERLGIPIPIVQAPMAGISTPRLAAAVANAGALGSLAIGATDASGAHAMIAQARALTTRPLNINVFAHRTPAHDPARESAWLDALCPLLRQFGAEPPANLRPPYVGFNDDEAAFQVLVAAAPEIVSFHFGLPTPVRAAALIRAGCTLIATATNLAESHAARDLGCAAVVAQGWEAGGHRGVFDPAAPDERLTTTDLTRLLVAHAGLPVVAAGGIMDGHGIRAALALGAVAAQLGTAFVACPESAADAAFRALLASPAARHTTVTRAISGRPARGIVNRFTTWGDGPVPPVPDYPTPYAAGKALHAAAKATGDHGYAAHWAGQGAASSRALPAAELIALLHEEMTRSA